MPVVTPSPTAERTTRRNTNADPNNNSNTVALQNHQEIRALNLAAVEEDEDSCDDDADDADAERIYYILCQELGTAGVDADVALLIELMHFFSTTEKPSYKVESNAKYFFAIRGHQAILQSLRAHPENSRIQGSGMMTLTKFAFGFGDGVQNALVCTGVIDIVRTAMERFPHDHVTVAASMGVLQYLARGHSLIQQMILHEGSIAHICYAMVVFPDSECIQRCGCHTLFYLNNNWPEETQANIWAANGVASIERVLMNYQHDKKIKTRAEELLETLLG